MTLLKSVPINVSLVSSNLTMLINRSRSDKQSQLLEKLARHLIRKRN